MIRVQPEAMPAGAVVDAGDSRGILAATCATGRDGGEQTDHADRDQSSTGSAAAPPRRISVPPTHHSARASPRRVHRQGHN